MPLGTHIASVNGISPLPAGPVVGGLIIGLIASGFLVWARDSLFRTRINRLLSFHMGLGIVAGIIVCLPGALDRRFDWSALQGILLTWTLLTASLSASVDKRLTLSSLSYLSAYIVTRFTDPEHTAFAAIAASNAFFTLNAMAIWTKPKEDLPDAQKRWLERREKNLKRLKELLAQEYPLGGAPTSSSSHLTDSASNST
jgi:hypothetical protein